MPGTLDDNELSDLLSSPEVAVLATVDSAGRPEGSPIWYEAAAGKIYVHVGASSKKARNIRKNPNVSLTIDTRVAPYRGVILRGTAREIPPDDAIRRRTAVRYLGEDTGAAYIAAIEDTLAESVRLEVTALSRYTRDYNKGF